MSLWHVIILAIVQGLAELLPVSSSAHVIVAEKLMGMDPSAPETTLLLVMLHTGTMFAVIAYFWGRWRSEFFSSWERFLGLSRVIVAALVSLFVAYPIILVIERLLTHGGHQAEIEDLFNKLNWIAPALAIVGILILYAGLREAREKVAIEQGTATPLGWTHAFVMGILQGLAIPFRGFSRSGSTISGGLLLGGMRSEIESFSFAMVVIITPLATAREMLRLAKTEHLHSIASLMPATVPSMIGMVFAFLAGLLALKWLSRWLETGKWYWFGIYCLVAALVVGLLYHGGY